MSFVKPQKNPTKCLEIERDLKTSTTKFLYTKLGDDATKFTISSLCLYITSTIPSPEEQMINSNAITKNFILSFEK